VKAAKTKESRDTVIAISVQRPEGTKAEAKLTENTIKLIEHKQNGALRRFCVLKIAVYEVKNAEKIWTF
jgi:hypothetical protein